MGILFEVKKDGITGISLTEYSIDNFDFTAESNDSLNLRHNDIIRGVTISGIINPEIIGDNTDRSREVDSARKLANWAVIPEFLDCYKDISYRITDAQGIVVKEDELTNCYVVEHIENFANENGTGKFKVVIRERGR